MQPGIQAAFMLKPITLNYSAVLALPPALFDASK